MLKYNSDDELDDMLKSIEEAQSLADLETGEIKVELESEAEEEAYALEMTSINHVLALRILELHEHERYLAAKQSCLLLMKEPVEESEEIKHEATWMLWKEEFKKKFPFKNESYIGALIVKEDRSQPKLPYLIPYCVIK